MGLPVCAYTSVGVHVPYMVMCVQLYRVQIVNIQSGPYHFQYTQRPIPCKHNTANMVT